MLLSISNFKRIFVIAIAASSLAWIGFRIVEVQLGHSVPGNKTEAWLGNVARIRELFYAKQPEGTKKTIFIISGSNSLFSIASNVLAERTGYNVRNYALHAGMHIDVLFSQIRSKVKMGDIVIAPMEWEQRNRTAINQFDYENYLHHFSKSIEPPARTLYDGFTSVPLRRWADGIKSYLYLPHDAVSYWDFYTTESLQYTWENRQEKLNYSHMALNEFGDINIGLPMTSSTWKDGSTFQVPEVSDSKWLKQLVKWNTYFEEKGAKLFLTSPILLDGNSPDLVSINTWRKISKIRDQMATTETPLHCDPVASTFSSIYRYDTVYHANAEGARQRTKELGDCVIDFISGKDVQTTPIDPETVVLAIKTRLSDQLRDFGAGNMPFQVRLREVTLINQTIIEHHKKTGKYPRSSIPRDWGLPVGLDLSTSRAISSPGDGPTITYWSNEAGYKLVAKAPEIECTVVSANWPQLIDPVGLKNNDLTLCTGFGYWTEDQKHR